MNVPNLLTVIRFSLIPLFGYFLFKEQYVVAVVLFLLSGLTDILDGYIARKYGLVTSWGKFADPLADKLMQITALILLCVVHKLIPYIVLLIVMAKELLLGAGMLFLYKKQNVIASANWYGKAATVIFYVAIVMTIVLKRIEKLKDPQADILVGVLIALAVVSTLFAFFMYAMEFRKIRKGDSTVS